MKILAIETSCDETALCYLEATPDPENGSMRFVVHKNITHTQHEHEAYGGVYPTIAKREHLKNLPIILEQIMIDQEIPDVICVTNGPGLEPALWCGIAFAQELGTQWNIPVVPVNHMEGHIFSILVPTITTQNNPSVPLENFSFSFTPAEIPLPALALLISGGHTEFVFMKNIGDYRVIGKTRDDAVGEAFDKVARMLDLPYPGGPEISKLAAHYTNQPLPEFPRPMIHTPDFDFSFSGLKTAVLYYTQSLSKPLTLDIKKAIAKSFEDAVCDVFNKKVEKALEETGAQMLIVAGGVSANIAIQETLTRLLENKFPETSIKFPIRSLTGDNALMIALAGYFKVQKNPDTVYPDIKAIGSLTLE